jgi:hypothetical protein
VTKLKSQGWFERKIAELGDLLRRLPADRQQAFADTVVDQPEGPLSDDRALSAAEADSDDDRAPESQQKPSDT